MLSSLGLQTLLLKPKPHCLSLSPTKGLRFLYCKEWGQLSRPRGFELCFCWVWTPAWKSQHRKSSWVFLKSPLCGLEGNGEIHYFPVFALSDRVWRHCPWTHYAFVGIDYIECTMHSEVVHMGEIGNLPKPLRVTTEWRHWRTGLTMLLVFPSMSYDLWLSLVIVSKQGLLGHRGDLFM